MGREARARQVRAVIERLDPPPCLTGVDLMRERLADEIAHRYALLEKLFYAQIPETETRASCSQTDALLAERAATAAARQPTGACGGGPPGSATAPR